MLSEEEPHGRRVAGAPRRPVERYGSSERHGTVRESDRGFRSVLSRRRRSLPTHRPRQSRRVVRASARFRSDEGESTRLSGPSPRRKRPPTTSGASRSPWSQADRIMRGGPCLHGRLPKVPLRRRCRHATRTRSPLLVHGAPGRDVRNVSGRTQQIPTFFPRRTGRTRSDATAAPFRGAHTRGETRARESSASIPAPSLPSSAFDRRARPGQRAIGMTGRIILAASEPQRSRIPRTRGREACPPVPRAAGTFAEPPALPACSDCSPRLRVGTRRSVACPEALLSAPGDRPACSSISDPVCPRSRWCQRRARRSMAVGASSSSAVQELG